MMTNCPECNGTGFYVGLVERDVCNGCGGTGKGNTGQPDIEGLRAIESENSELLAECYLSKRAVSFMFVNTLHIALTRLREKIRLRLGCSDTDATAKISVALASLVKDTALPTEKAIWTAFPPKPKNSPGYHIKAFLNAQGEFYMEIT